MQQYGQALREDYYKNQEKLDNFIKEYGQFTSPIEKDAENFYKLTTGGLGKMFDDADSNGIDLLRSREGRSLIQRYIMSRPYQDLAKLKQSAEYAKQYIENAGRLDAQGKYNKDQAEMLDGNLKGWDTLEGNGVWSKSSPSEFMSVEDMLLPTIKQLEGAKRLDTTLSGKGKYKGYRVYNVSMDQARDAVNNSFADLMQKPSMKYFFKTSGMTEDQFKEFLASKAQNQIGNEEKKDDLYFFNQEKAYNQQIAREKMAFDYQLAKEKMNQDRINALINAGYIDPTTGLPDAKNTTKPIGPYESVKYDGATNFNTALGGGSEKGNQENFNNIADKMMQFWEERSKGQYGYRHKDKNGKDDTKSYSLGIKNFWKRVKKEGLGNAVKNGLFKKDKKTGVLIPTATYTRLVKDLYMKDNGNGLVVNDGSGKTMQRSLEYRNLFSSQLAGQNLEGAIKDITGSSGNWSNNITSNDGIKNIEMRANENVYFTPYLSIGQFTGKGGSEMYNAAKNFNAYLKDKQIPLYFTRESRSTLKGVSLPRTNGGRTVEYDAIVYIKKEDFQKFASTYYSKASVSGGNSLEEASKALGVTMVDKQGKIASSGKFKPSDIEYVQVPISRRMVNNNTTHQSQRDTEYFKNLFGQKWVSENAAILQGKSMGQL